MTIAVTYLARCAALQRRGLPRDLVHELQDAGNVALLEALEQGDDTALQDLAREWARRQASVAAVAQAAPKVEVFRYFPPEGHCEHSATEVRRLNVVQDGQVIGGADVSWCPACASVVGPPPVEPMLWDGDQA